jgi:hypothetical protein
VSEVGEATCWGGLEQERLRAVNFDWGDCSGGSRGVSSKLGVVLGAQQFVE